MDTKIRLSKQHLEFLIYMLEITDAMEAVQKFAVLLVEERVDPNQMSKYLDKIIARTQTK